MPDSAPERVDAQLRVALESVLNQTYPALEWLIVAGGAAPLPDLPRAPGVSVNILRTDTNGAAWREAARHASGTFVAIMRPDARWTRQQIAGDVARLLRTPHLVACDHASNAASVRVPDDPQGATIRRDALLAEA